MHTVYTKSCEQLADIFTKVLPSAHFEHLLSKLGSRNFLDPAWGGVLEDLGVLGVRIPQGVRPDGFYCIVGRPVGHLSATGRQEIGSCWRCFIVQWPVNHLSATGRQALASGRMCHGSQFFLQAPGRCLGVRTHSLQIFFSFSFSPCSFLWILCCSVGMCVGLDSTLCIK